MSNSSSRAAEFIAWVTVLVLGFRQSFLCLMMSVALKPSATHRSSPPLLWGAGDDARLSSDECLPALSANGDACLVTLEFCDAAACDVVGTAVGTRGCCWVGMRERRRGGGGGGVALPLVPAGK